MEIAKAVILAGRPRHDQPWPSVPTGSKHLVPLANKPILFHNLEELRRAGVLEANIAVEADTGNSVRSAIRDGSDWHLTVAYTELDRGAGVHQAAAAARAFTRDEPVLVQRADAVMEDTHTHIRAFADAELDALVLRIASASLPADRRIAGYLLSPWALRLLARGEGPENDVLPYLRDQGGRVHVSQVDACLACDGGEESLLEANRRILQRLPRTVQRRWLTRSEVQGTVALHPTAQLTRSLVRGPAFIGARCRLTDAYVGPYTSIGADVVIDGAEVEHSVVLAGAQIGFVGSRIESSVIGRRARIGRGFGVPAGIRLSVGDDARVILG